MKEPLISVIVPIYKVEQYLHECIESLINQTYKNIEIILVDDGSPDNCPLICDQYKDNNENIVVIHKKNGGLVSARKAGVLVATGDYISYVDGDDYVENDHFEKIADAIIKYSSDIITTDYSSVIHGEKIIYEQAIRFEYLVKNEIKKEVIPHMISVSPFFTFGVLPSVWTKCFRKDLVLDFQQSIPDSIVMGEDAALTFPCILHAESICHIKENGYIYRISPSSITNSYDAKLQLKIESLLQYLNKFFDYRDEQMVEYIAFLSIRVASNEIIGNSDIKSAVEKVRDYLQDEKIQYSILKGNIPLKDKVLFLCIRKRLYIALKMIKWHWTK